MNESIIKQVLDEHLDIEKELRDKIAGIITANDNNQKAIARAYKNFK